MRRKASDRYDVAIVGGGFTGLTAAHELGRAGLRVVVVEQDKSVGGLASSFDVSGTKLERFYHHWFTNDRYVMELIGQLDLDDHITFRPTRTGMYYANKFHRLSSPIDVLEFRPLSLINRIRLGGLVLKARRVQNWRALEAQTAEEWLIKLAGPEVYRVVWAPLLKGKFGKYASEISAVWMWNKLKLRGGSRGKGGAEVLAYFRGGFAALAEAVTRDIIQHGGEVITNQCVTGLWVENNCVRGVGCGKDRLSADQVLLTPALPIVAELMRDHVSNDYFQRLQRVKYLANVCLVLELDRSLSDIYWLNVNDPSFPYVAVIEHTNMETSQTYGGRHIVYLSKYLLESDALYHMANDEVLTFSVPHIQRMFPEFSEHWIERFNVWKAKHTQPIVGCHYSRLIPDHETPIENCWICSMAQIYPEDRGTNYAVREGQSIADRMIKHASTLKLRSG